MKTRAPLNGQVLMGGLGYLIIVALLIFAAANLLIPIRDWQRLNRDLDQARQRLDELQVLFPLYSELVRMDSPQRWPGLKLPVPQTLTEHEVTAIPERFQRLAADCQVELGAVSPRVMTDAASGHRYLSVELKATGTYAQLKDLLLGLAQMPVLERITKLEIRRETLHEQFNILAQLALE